MTNVLRVRRVLFDRTCGLPAWHDDADPLADDATLPNGSEQARQHRWEGEVERLCDALFNGSDDLSCEDAEVCTPAAWQASPASSSAATVLLDMRKAPAKNARCEERTMPAILPYAKTGTTLFPAPAPGCNARRRRSSGVWRGLLTAACLLLAGVFLFKAVPSGSFLPGKDGPPLQPVGHAASEQRRWVTSNIEDIRVGDWVLAENPELSDAQRAAFEEIDPATWRKLSLRMQKSNGGTLEIELLRSVEWIEATDARPGKTVHLDLAELGAKGNAEVVSIGPCPEIAPRPDDGCRVVTGTFAHSSAEVVNVSIEGLDEPIGTTSSHPFWSEDRQAFIEAGQLRTGERLRTAGGTLKHVTRINRHPGSEPVYNLEVEVEHVYFVSARGVLVHNRCVNANRRLSRRPNHGYAIFDKRTGRIHKFGISSGKCRSDGKSYRGLSQMRKLNRAAGYERYDTITLRKSPNRARALGWEDDTVGFFRENLGHDLPGNELPIGNPY